MSVPVQAQRATDSLEANLVKNSRKLMVAIDGSVDSKRIFDWTVNNLVKDGDLIIAIHVVSDLESWELFESDNLTGLDSLKTAVQGVADKLLQGCSDWLNEHTPKFNDVTVMTDVKMGNAKEELCNLAESLEVDFIVMGSRSDGLLKRLLLGSTTDYVVRNCKRPVVVVPK
ncbi:hypothetical protein HDU76_002798 [Blyttiomyces sp. JEL0837]|nr:hypothetical protein HDU76_002798 [Blyttiomyces sp. JEL0837]